jgi:hypothetical protein
MLFVILIATGLVGAASLRVLLPRAFGLEGVSGRWRVIALVLVIVGLASTLIGAGQLLQSWERRNWLQVEATVVRSELVGGRNYRPEVELEYRVDGATYHVVSNVGATGFGSKRSRYDVGKHLIADYPPGRTVMLHYDPAEPDRAVLLIRPSLQSFVLAGVGVLLLALGGALVVMPRVREQSDGADHG